MEWQVSHTLPHPRRPWNKALVASRDKSHLLGEPGRTKCWVVATLCSLLWVTCLEDREGDTGRVMHGVCKGIGRGWVRVEKSLKGREIFFVWPKICVFTVTRGQGRWQENWFRAWSGLSYLCGGAAGIKLRAASEKMIPVGMTSLRLYVIRCLYLILLQWNPFLQSNIFIFPYC